MPFFLIFERAGRAGFRHFGEKILEKIKVEVKQTFDKIDAIIFEAALTLNDIETKYKQKEYVS
jgi:hypothetical protein